MQLQRDISLLSSQSREERPSFPPSVSYVTRNKYRSMANLTSEEMLQASIPSPRLEITYSPRQRQPRFDYCDLCVTGHSTNSAWVRYNENRIDELQKRIDRMLQIDDLDETQFLLTNLNPVRKSIDDVLLRNPRRRYQTTYYHDQIRMLKFFCFK